MRPKPRIDLYLLIAVSFLTILGLVILWSASMVISQERLGQPYGYLKHQLIFGLAIGLFGAFIAYKIPYLKWQKLALPFVLVTLVFLILVLLPQFSYQFGGARRWLSLGPIIFQPSEVAKLAFIIYFAAVLKKRDKQQHQLVIILVLLAAVSTLLILQPDISTLGIIVVSCLAIYFIAGARLSHLLIIGMSYGLVLAILIKLAPYRWHRLLVYLYPNIDIAGIGYQVNQALLALGSGGIFGLGLGHSRQKYNYLPEPMGDSIFAILGEELGFLGVILILGLFTFIFIRSFQTAQKADSNFGRLLAFGIGCWLFFQSFVNMAAITTLLPMTGVPLPFVSYGGSSMVISLVAVGILLNISKDKAKIS